MNIKARVISKIKQLKTREALYREQVKILTAEVTRLKREVRTWRQYAANLDSHRAVRKP